jgi:DAK2 domain fusion protein YloV
MEVPVTGTAAEDNTHPNETHTRSYTRLVPARRLLLKAHDLKQVLQRYLNRLRQYREALNRLNVYPVPDGDTGTNMTLTVESVVDATDGAESMDEVASAMADGSLMGAQGNSGIILSQILRGIADAFRTEQSVGARQIVDALDRASAAAYKAVGKPVEGTILTVLREAAEAARAAETPAGEDLSDFLIRIYKRAEESLNETPELLPVLKEAGVVDAGGAGFLLLLAAFLEEVSGEDVALPEAVFSDAAVRLLEYAADDAHEGGIADLRYEVMYLLRSEEEDSGDRLRSAWADLGDSIVVVGGGGVWNCHIHTDEIGPAIEAGVAVGRPERIKVTDLLDQAADVAAHRSFEPLPEFAEAEVGVVAVAIGAGIIDLFRESGAQGIVAGGQTMNPSVRDVLAVVESVSAETVVVLPNNKNIVPVAEQLDALTTKTVRVVPTHSVASGIAAMFGYMPSRDAEATLAEMTGAAGACSWGEVTRAVRDARTPAGAISEGDWLGIVADDVAVIGQDAATVGGDVLDALVGEGTEVVTVYVGSEADEGATDAIREHLGAAHPKVAVTIVDGGQPLYPYIFGAE